MAYDCIPKAIANLFYKYGKFLARHPLPFLIFPVLLTGVLAIGILTLDHQSDVEYLYSPINGRSKDEREYFRDNFIDDDHGYFSSLRELDIYGFLHLLIEDSDARNVLNYDAKEAIVKLNQFVLDFENSHKGNKYKYIDVCSTWDGYCTYPGILEIITNQTDVDNIDIMYPFHTINGSGKVVNLIQELGGVNFDDIGLVQSSRSIRLSYFVRWDSSKDEKKSASWLNGVRDKLLKYKDSRIKMEFETSLAMEQELEDSIKSILPLVALAFILLGIFAVCSCLMADWVRAKPWVALAGLVAAGLGIGSSGGLTSACGVKFASVVGTMPFLIIGIGVDDMFILVAAWRYTSYKLSVEERMGQTLSNAAMSITITTITDALAFGIGCLTPFRSITIWCAYTGVAVVFVYIYMITFTSACMVYSGRREEENKHPFTCQEVLPEADAGEKSRAYQLFCAGGSYEQQNDISNGGTTETHFSKTPLPPIEHSNPKDSEMDGIQLPWMNKFLEDIYAPFLLSIPVKIGVVVVYLALIATAIYGITDLEQGLDRANLAPDNSYFRKYFTKYVRDFSANYGPTVMVGFNEPLDYTTQAVRDEIHDVISKLRESDYFVNDDNFVIFWLNDYESFLSENGTNINNLTSEQFIYNLREYFLDDPRYQYYSLDVTFNGDNSMITDSRLFVQSRELSDATDELNMMLDAREAADDSKFRVEVFSPFFIYFDQYNIIAINTIQNMGIAIASMAVVALILIPSLTTVVWVTLATLSICTCVVGFMSFWDVTLDGISMINLIMGIGFSVDFAAHISYHYVVTKAEDPNERAREAIGYLGLAIIQGFVSTVLAVLLLATSDTYIFRTFFKLVFLVMIFGFFHAMFLLPVLLSTLNLSWCKKKSSKGTTGNGVVPSRNSVESGNDNNAFNNIT